MKTSRSIRAGKNLITGFILQYVILVVSLLSTPLLLRWLGDDRYGAFRTANDWTGYLQMMVLGVDGSLMAILAMAVGEGDQKKIRLTLATGIRTYLKIAIGIVLGSALLGLFITKLVNVKSTLASELQIGYWIGFLGSPLIILAPLQLLAHASQRSYFINKLLLLQSFIIIGLSLLFSWVGFGIPGMYLALLIGSIFFNIFAVWDGISQYRDVFSMIFNRHSQASIEKKLWQLNLPTLLLKLSGQLALLTDNIIIAAFLGSAAVVPFFITQRLASIAQTQVQSIGNATWASLTELYAQAELQTFNERLIELTQLIAVLGLTFIIPIAAYNPYFIKLWVGQDRFDGDGLSFLAAINGFLLGIFSLWGWCFTGTGNAAKVVPPSLLSSIINFLTALFCTQKFGSVGPLLGTLVGFLGVNLWWLPILLQQTFGTSSQKLLIAIAKPLGIGLPYAALIWLVSRTHTPWGWIGLVVEMGCAALLYLIFAWLIVLNTSQRSTWRQRFVVILGKT